MGKANLSSYFLTPVLNLRTHVGPDVLFNDAFVNTYLKDAKFEDEQLGGHFYFLFKSSLSPQMSGKLEGHPLFVEKYPIGEDQVMFKFKIPDEQVHNVVTPFLQGKYSEVDKTYVDANFPDEPTSKSYANRLVFYKHELIRKYQEERIGLDLPDDAEVWDKPLESNETFNYTPSQLFNKEANPVPTA